MGDPQGRITLISRGGSTGKGKNNAENALDAAHQMTMLKVQRQKQSYYRVLTEKYDYMIKTIKTIKTNTISTATFT